MHCTAERAAHQGKGGLLLVQPKEWWKTTQFGGGQHALSGPYQEDSESCAENANLRGMEGKQRLLCCL